MLKKTESTQFFADTLKTITLQAGVLYNPNSGIFIHGDVTLGKVNFKQGLKATSFIINGIKQWNMLSHDDFDQVFIKRLFNMQLKKLLFRVPMNGIIIKRADVQLLMRIIF